MGTGAPAQATSWDPLLKVSQGPGKRLEADPSPPQTYPSQATLVRRQATTLLLQTTQGGP